MELYSLKMDDQLQKLKQERKNPSIGIFEAGSRMIRTREMYSKGTDADQYPRQA